MAAIRTGLLAVFVMAMALFGDRPVVAAGRPNVLLICVDDLRPQLGCYGRKEMITPNLDKLASQGRFFTHHYVQVPICGAARYAMLTSKRPAHKAAYGNATHVLWPKQDPGTPVSMPGLFKKNGYRTVCIGKVSHHPGGHVWGKQIEVPFSWDLAYAPIGTWKTAWGAFFSYDGGRIRAYEPSHVNDRTMPAYEAADVPDTGYADGLNALEAIKQLRTLKNQPFFLAVGFYKPHLPHNAPKKYWDLYDRRKIKLARNPFPPTNVDPRISLHKSQELTTHYAWPSGAGNVTKAEARRTRHGYFACVSYVDAQIGKVLNELERLGLDRKTIVVLWGDHGWHLGNQGIWGKATTFEVALRSPLLIRVPDMPAPGQSTNGLVETVDLYPTLADLCGLEAPDDLAGASLRPLIEDPAHPGKTGAMSYWRRGQAKTLRTQRWRIIEDRKEGKTLQIELYDHDKDPLETVNVAKANPENARNLLEQLRAQVPRMKRPTGH